MSKKYQFLVGLDLGQSQDYTALTAVERRAERQPGGDTYLLRYLNRFALKTSYPDILTGVTKIVSAPPLPGNTALVIDKTGVGAPVVDLFRAANLPVDVFAMTITGGSTPSQAGAFDYSVPKRDLATTVKILLDGERLRIRKSLPERPLLEKELQTFRVKITVSANDQYEAWREADHDDLVLALALACWLGEQGDLNGEMLSDIKPTPKPEPPKDGELWEWHSPPLSTQEERDAAQIETLWKGIRRDMLRR